MKIADFLTTEKCKLVRFTRGGFPVAYFCELCRAGNKTGECLREELRQIEAAALSLRAAEEK